MQTPKTRNNSSGAPKINSPGSDVSQKNSPQAAPSEASPKISPRVVRQLKTSARYLEPTLSSSNLTSKAPKNRSPKVSDRISPGSPLSEKKRPTKVAELESQISQLESDLKNVKEQLISSESSKNQAEKNAEESKQKFLSLSEKLEDSNNSSALASALDEIKHLKIQLESKSSESEETELDKLKENLEEMKDELKNCKKSELEARELVGETLTQLETAKKMVEALRSDGSELDQSRARVLFLEELVSKLEGESIELRSSLEASETKRDEEKRNVEKIKSESGNREAELEAELRKSKYEIEELRGNLMDKENELQAISEENDDLVAQVEKNNNNNSNSNSLTGLELDKVKAQLEEMKARLGEKEVELEVCRGNERELVVKVGCLGEEVEKGRRKWGRVAEQLEGAQVANAEVEAELRRLKVQSDQWRKAAEAAAAMLSSSGINGGDRFVERTGSMDSSRFSPGVDEDMLKRKNGDNVLRRLWKKPQK